MDIRDDRACELPLESLRRLARGLVFERGAADDVVQEAWLAALETRGEIRGLGAWLAGAVRRLARQQGREERRRDEREQRAARSEALASAAEASARIEILQRLLAAVEQLPSPYREAIVLRYFDDQPPRAIARRLGIPVNTVRTHVRRGLERLRAELDPGPGREREALLAALVPLLGPGAGRGSSDPVAPSTMTSLMRHPLLLATSAVALGTLAWFVARPGAPGPVAGAPNLATGPSATPSSPPSPATDPAIQSQVQGREAPTPDSRAAAASAWAVRGSVLRVAFAGVSMSSQTVPNVPLVGRVFAGGRAAGAPLSEERFQADEHGAFAWAPATPEGLFAVEVRADLAGVYGRPVHAWFLSGDAPPQDWWLTLYPLDVTLRGTVRGPDGAPLADAWVGFAPGDEARAVRSAADGSFALACAFELSDRVCAWKAGLAPGLAKIVKPVPGSEHIHEITLQPELRVGGTVRGPDGAPLAGAEVTVSDQGLPPAASSVRVDGEVVVRQSHGLTLGGSWPRTHTDGGGRFEIGGIHPAAMFVELRATAPGHRPGEAERSEVDPITERDWNFVLARCVTVTGRVRAAGLPSEAAWVTVGDGPGEKGAPEAWCDAEGRFTLADVAPGRQHLWIWRRGLAQLRHDLDVRAGMAALELELQPGHSVAGVVLGPDGAPVPWASVIAEDATGAEPPALAGYGTQSGPDGRFRLADLPACRLALTVGARGYEYLTQEVALDRDDLVLRFAREVQALRGAPAPVVPATAESGNASLRGRLLDHAGNARAGEEIELAAASEAGPTESARVARLRPAQEQRGGVRQVIPEPKPAFGRQWRTTTDAHGEFLFTALPAGSFDARWIRVEGGLGTLDLETRVTLAAGEEQELELRPTGQATLRGALEFLTQPPAGAVTASYGTPPVFGAPPSGMPAVVPLRLIPLLEDEGAPCLRRGTFARDGSFELEGLAPGKWKVEAELFFPGGRRVQAVGMTTVPERGLAELELGVLYPQ